MEYVFKDEISSDMFNAHLKELKKRIENNEFLNVELDDELLDQIDDKHIVIASNLLKELNANDNINKKVEIFLLATHLMKMEENL